MTDMGKGVLFACLVFGVFIIGIGVGYAPAEEAKREWNRHLAKAQLVAGIHAYQTQRRGGSIDDNPVQDEGDRIAKFWREMFLVTQEICGSVDGSDHPSIEFECN